MNASKKIVLTLTMLSVLFAGISPATAQDWSYQQGGYPAPYQQQQRHEVLKKVLVGGALVGLGFLAGRLTAPKPNYGYGHGGYGQQYQPQYNHPAHYRGHQGHGGHRF